jgi:hypothetical protein
MHHLNDAISARVEFLAGDDWVWLAVDSITATFLSGS